MADLHNVSTLSGATDSTIYRLNESTSTILDELANYNFNGTSMSTSTNNTTSNSTQLTDSSHTIDDFPGFAPGDDCPKSEVDDLFHDVFYHVTPLKDSTNIIFYNRKLYEMVLTGLSQEYADFPTQNTKKFRVKTHVDGLQCILTMERSVLSICASGPGHQVWKQKKFKKLSENMYRGYVKNTNSALDTSVNIQDKESLSASLVSTQPNQSGLITILEEGTPGGIRIQEQPDIATDPQDTPVMRRICIMMDMIHSLQNGVSTMQNEIRTLTKEVNELASQATYKTVDETHISNTVIESINETDLMEHTDSKGLQSTPLANPHYSAVLKEKTGANREPGQKNKQQPNQQNANRPVFAEVQQLGGLQRTSTPKMPNQQQSDTQVSTPRLNQQRNKEPRSENQPQPRIQPNRKSTKKVLLIGDSVISPVNPKGLKKEVFKHSISGAKIDHIFDQSDIFNMKQFSDIIISVGGNDASSGTDVEYFEERYEQVILNLKQANDASQIYLCTISPRCDTDTDDFNQAIHRLCQEHNLTMVDINEVFYDKQGKVIERYYSDDLIHLSTSGVKRLLGEIEKHINIVESFENCAFKSRPQKRGRDQKGFSRQTDGNRSSNRPRRGRPSSTNGSNRNNNVACYKCGETNHETSQCRHKEQLKCHYCGFLGHKSGRCLNK